MMKILVIGLFGGCLLTWSANQVVAPASEVRARRIVLEDKNGTARIIMETADSNDAPSITIMNRASRKVAEISALENSASILLWGEDQRVANLVFSSGTANGTPAILIREATGFRIAIGAEESDMSFAPADPRRLGLFVLGRGGPSGEKAGIGASINAAGRSKGFIFIDPGNK
jgi:hypothetical protein